MTMSRLPMLATKSATSRPLPNEVKELQVHEARRPPLEPVRLVGAVAHEVAGDLAPGRFDAGVGVPLELDTAGHLPEDLACAGMSARPWRTSLMLSSISRMRTM